MNTKEIINKMSLEEKLQFCTGKDMWHTKEIKRLNIESIKMTDGPHGLRCQKDKGDNLGINNSLPATCFPTAVNLADSFDEELVAEVAKAIGNEAKNYGVSIVLGPGCNIKRNPLGGRNFEYFSEDPYLAGKMAASYIKAMEENGVMSSLKHFAVNSQEYKRQNGNSIIDERTLREIYLRPFEMAVKNGKPSTVMCSYNKINGIHASDNSYLLQDILRKQWGYEGLVVTDWGAMNDRIAGFKAGCDLNMPGGSKYMLKECLRAVREGKLSGSDIDSSVERILKLLEKGKVLENTKCDFEANDKLAIQVGSESAVLLKNEDNILPLNKTEICLLGYMCEDLRYQGSGSSHINPTKLIQLTQLYKDVKYAPCTDKYGNLVDLKSGVELAKKCEKVVIVAGLPENYESESFDRENMDLPKGYNKLIEEVSKVNENVVVVLLAGSACQLPWLDKVKGLVYMGLAGQGCSKAIDNILTGKVNPSGRLAESWPVSYDDVISKDYFGVKNPQYRESIYVGYRYYDKANIKVNFPFGFGLSYADFSYKNLSINGNKVSVEVTNNSSLAGKEVVQLYVVPKDNRYREVKQLKAFQKIFLNPEESKNVSFEICDDWFSIYDNGFKKIKGEYEILVGGRSDKLELSQIISVEGETFDFSCLENSWYENFVNEMNKEDYEKLLGYKLEKEIVNHKGQFDKDNSIAEMKDESLFMAIFYKLVRFGIGFTFKKEERNFNNPTYKMMVTAATDCPIRALEISAGGYISTGLANGMLEIANGHIGKGLIRIITNN